MHRGKIVAGLVIVLALGISGCAWGPCGPVFIRSASPKTEKVDLRQAADSVKDAPAAPQPPAK